MTPGNKYVLRFKNTLPYQPKSEEHNIFKDPNVTNVHTHGLHISGESPGDDVTRYFEGGYEGDYVYDIPANHMGGTYWYHAHHHGSTFLQVSSGAFGLILIDDVPVDQVPTNIPDNVSNMEEKHLVVGFLEPGNAAGTGGDTLISGNFSSGWTVNGTVNGDVCVPNNTWQNWRMLVADQDSRLVDLEIGEGCEVALMARDGVWRTQAPKVLTDNQLTLTGASRADLAVRCTSDSTISVAGVQVANVIVDDSLPEVPSVHPYAADGVSMWSASRPKYLRDLRDSAGVLPADSENIRMGARSVLGSKFNANEANLTKDPTGVQEWSLNGATNHPFHLHIYHVQVQSDCGPYEAGEFYDVIAGNCDLRFDMEIDEAYEGMTIFHCHILEHEDQGAMGWMDVTDGRAPPVFPVDENMVFDEWKPIGGTNPTPPDSPSNLSATTLSTSEIDLSWTDNSLDETGFVIDRSDNDIDYAQIAALGGDSTAFTDTGLASSTTYYYQVAAVNDGGTSAYSNTADATTEAAGVGTSIAVKSISVSTVGAGKGQRRGQATIVIADDVGNPLTNALVNGEFYGDFMGKIFDADTGNDDTVEVQSENTVPNKLKNPALTFCVTTVKIPDSNLIDFTGNACSPP
jgi:FtsP/CotA-like multicopper oxidase with cupredoxin domain